MEFIYSTNVNELHAQLESCQIATKMSRRDASVAELIGFVAYLRSADKMGFEEDQQFAKALGVAKSNVSKALTVIRLGAPQLVAKNRNGFATPDESVVETVCALVDAHNGKAVSGIYTALTKDDEAEARAPRTLAAMVAAMLAEARKNGHELSAIVEEVMAQLESPAE
jgi:hypothetical protein